MSYQTLAVETNDGVAKIRMMRPDRLNALNSTMRGELLHAIGEAADNAKALILTGTGKGFCAGQDLGDASTLGRVNLEQTLSEEYTPLILALADCPIPTIAAVNGTAAGGGANLAMAADICIAARSASFLQAFARIGLMPDCGGTYWLPRRVGLARALGLAMLAETISAEQAAAWGLIWEVVPDGDLGVRTHQIAERLARGPTAAYREMKRAIRGSMDTSLEEQLALEARLQGGLGKTHDFREGVMAFIEKRQADFRGV